MVERAAPEVVVPDDAFFFCDEFVLLSGGLADWLLPKVFRSLFGETCGDVGNFGEGGANLWLIMAGRFLSGAESIGIVSAG